MIILITYLQNEVHPPILPKLLSMSKFKKIKLKNIKTFSQKIKIKHIIDIPKVYQFGYESFYISDGFQKIFEELSEAKKENKTQNLTPVSVLLLEFLIFLARNFKANTSFVDGFNEKFDSRSNIINEQKELAKKYPFFVREPFNNTYNPAQNFKNGDEEKFNNMLNNVIDKIINKGQI